MQYKCDKIGFLSFIREALCEEDCARIEDYLQCASEHQLITSEDEFCDYLYCWLRVCDCNVDKLFECSKVPFPLEIVSNQSGISLSKEIFERIVSIRFGRKNAEEILSVCDKVASREPSYNIQKNYGDFYTMLFVCGFDKEVFMRNLANKYKLAGYIKRTIQKDLDALKNNHPEVVAIENALKLEIENRSSVATYHERDRYDESPSHFRPWSAVILEAVSNERFAEQLAWMIYEVFPDSNWEDYKKRVDADMSLLSHHSEITSLASSNSIQEVTIKYEASDGPQTFSVKSPILLNSFRRSFVDYYRFIEGATADDEDYIRQKEIIKEDLGCRLLRRVALLLCHYGLYHEVNDDDDTYDMWFMDSGKEHFIKFGAEYGSLIFDLLKSVDKCEKVLFDIDRKGKDQKKEYGVNPKSKKGNQISKKAKWDIIKYRLRKWGWQRNEIQIEAIPHIPFSLKMFDRLNINRQFV